MTHTPAPADTAHLIDCLETARAAALRNSRQINLFIPDLMHAIQHGRTDAAVDLLTTIDGLNGAVMRATTPVE